jgi:hypothetical protein
LLIRDPSRVQLVSLLVFLLSLSQQAEFFVPLHFQRVGYQTIVRVNAHIADASLVSFILSALHLFLAKPIPFGQSSLDFTLDFEGHLERERCHTLYQQLANGVINTSTRDSLADRFSRFHTVLLAHVIWS